MKKEYIYAGASVILWSTTAAVTKLVLKNLDSMQIMLASSAVAFVFLFFLNLFKGTLKELQKYKVKAWLIISGLGFLGIFVYHLFLYMGIDAMDASQAFIINYLWPMMAVVFGCLILKEKMTVRKAIAVVLSFVGVIIVTADGNLLNIKGSTALGAAYCVVAAVAYGLFTVMNKKTKYNKFVTMMLFYLVATIVSLIYIMVEGSWFVLGGAELVGMCWIGIFTTAIPFVTWALALDRGDTAKVSNLAYITPFLSLVWTSLILRESFNPYSLIGLLVIVLGIFVQLKDGKSVNQRKKSE